MTPLTLMALLVGSSVVFSSAGVATKLALPYAAPMLLAFFRFAIASFIVTPIFLLNHKRIVTAKEIRVIAPMALFSAINVALFYIALQFTTANASAVIYTVVPLVASVLAHNTLNEPLGIQKIAGIVIGLIVALVIVVLPVVQHGGAVGDVRGNILIFLGALSWSIYTVGSRHLTTTHHYSPLLITTVTLWVSAALFLFLSILLGQTDVSKIDSPNAAAIILYVGLVIGVLAYVFYQWVIKKTSATTASLTMYIQPVAAVVMNGIILGERITAGFVLGTILVFAGVFLATAKQMVKQFME